MNVIAARCGNSATRPRKLPRDENEIRFDTEAPNKNNGQRGLVFGLVRLRSLSLCWIVAADPER
jgi:hypothetical protein